MFDDHEAAGSDKYDIACLVGHVLEMSGKDLDRYPPAFPPRVYLGALAVILELCGEGQETQSIIDLI